MWLRDFIRLIYPEICPVCNGTLTKSEPYLCTACILKLPRTGFHREPDNKVEQTFWGRLHIQRAAAFLYFEKGNITQHLLHEIKYNGNRNLARYLGRLFARELHKYKAFTAEGIVPVPLHPKKEFRRGYNQATEIAYGLAEVLKVPVYTDMVVRDVDTISQTGQGRYERWQNIEHAFTLANKTAKPNTHLLLVDDVVTTGATIEAVGQLLHQHDYPLSVATIAYTHL